jgi:hypothetical protein
MGGDRPTAPIDRFQVREIRGGGAPHRLCFRGKQAMDVTMTTAHEDRVKRRNGAKGNGANDAGVLVSAVAMARHLCCVRSYLQKLVEQGVIERLADGRFDQDQSRKAYLTHLRAARKRTPKRRSRHAVHGGQDCAGRASCCRAGGQVDTG